VNMFGLFLCTQAVLEPMKKQNYGRIVSLSSVSAKRGGGVFGGAHYSASKAAVLGFSKNLAREVAQDGITVNCVTPGLINTEIWKALPEEDAKKVIDGIPMGRPGETQEIASTIAFLASEEASYITGEEIDINGGSHMD
ncbi:MAG TPA: SDR family NAD(P)-dependent oxidoreductase, partial [Chondromyces sp.]|nr:SDR family NAD(P)-dependent oxidoreductase [Chondromyces sp.]